MRALWLVGMMGSGKTTVGGLIAQQTGLAFVDTDARIEAENDLTVSGIWEIEGEQTFRDLESGQIGRIAAAGEDCVVATGGGVVLRPENVAAMRSNGTVVWLTAEPEQLAARVRTPRTRPLLDARRTEQRLSELLAEREQWYAEAAHHSVDTRFKSPEEVSREVILFWKGS